MSQKLTSASFEIKHLSNTVRFMVTSFDGRSQTGKLTLNRLTANSDKVPVASETLTVRGRSFQAFRIDNLRAGFYELNVRVSSRKLKLSADIRDGSGTSDADYSRLLITARDFVRQQL